MNRCFVKILIVSCAIVLCCGEDYPSDHDQAEQRHSVQDEIYSEHEEPDEHYSEDDDIRRHHHHHHRPQYVVTTTPRPKPPPTQSGPVPLPHPNPKSCPRYEEYHDCGSPCQVECATLGQVCNIQNIRCSDGCYCIPGFARLSSNGPCVPQFKCPEPYCPDNEVWLDCYQAPACDRECTRLGKPCDTVGGSCNAGCFCRSGYARHPKTGVCVPFKRCPSSTPPPPQCSKNEDFKSCGWRCSEDCDSDRCKYDKRPCEKGCFCKPGYARVNDKCVLRSFCTKTCPKYEKYLDCGNSCLESCAKHSSKCKPCDRSGCFCIEGYSRFGGVCRPDSQCPSNQCGAHEVYSECGSSCQENCDQRYCPDQCVKGCFCEKGYARVNGKCVPRNYCPKKCPKYERYLDCGNTCMESCYKNSGKCKECERSGCFCVEGYSRIDGYCRPDSQCPNTQCPAHELFLECGSACQDDCNENQACTDQCVQGCFCEDGYARINGVCVPRPKCKTCPLNEQYLECGNACIESCYEDSSKCVPCASSGCFCVDGYSRIDGVCRPDSQCPNRQCPTHELFLECGSVCQDDCEPNEACTEQCVRGCFCEDGYARINGVCVPRFKCKKCPKNEQYLKCGNTCIESCYEDISKCVPCASSGCFCVDGYSRIDGVCQPDSQCPNRQCPAHELFLECGSSCQDDCDKNKPCTDECVQGCFCEDGYARIKGVCVPRFKCKKCPKNEQYLKCGNACIESCYEDSSKCVPCASSGCFCVDGYSRINGVCRPDSQCPNRQCPAHELFLECGSVCQDDCEPNESCTEQCVRGCFCEDGYARVNGKCVPRLECPVVCPDNEHYEPCGNLCIEHCDRDLLDCSDACYPGCYCDEGYARINEECVPRKQCEKCPLNEEFLTCGNGCQDLCDPSATQCSNECVKGCFCLPGYSRINGLCVPRSKCFNCRSGEEYYECSNTCLERCDRNVILCPTICEEGCFCSPGFSRIKKKCLPSELCPQCRENEEYQDCGNRCFEKCGNNICPLDLVCNGGCYCKSGYKRDGDKCVPENECPPQCTNPNEVYSSCGNNCTDLCQYPNSFCTLECYNGCFCAEGYSRLDYNSPCVPTDQCPGQCSGENEQYYECGNPCFDSCPDSNRVCTLQCVKGCYCKPNYVRLPPDGKCVPEWNCPNPCARPFEELNTCGNNCTELCPRPGRPCEKNCWKGCFCKKGYFRASYNGLCIPESKCPPPPVCTGPNEEVRDCGSRCDDDCPGIIYECPLNCQVGCYCKPGFKRVDRDGDCVPENQCPPVCTNPNEAFTQCGSPCREQCPYPDALCPEDCYLGCYCQDGYSRIDGECVPTSQCPSTCADPLETYSDCGNRCREQCNSGICAAVCEVGCFCKPGYSRQDGKCIPKKKCQPKCNDPNEEYTNCGNECQERCGPTDQACPFVCKVGCFCKAGYSRNNSVCIETSQCPSQCADPNEIYTTCGNTCREQCGARFCPALCETGCFCRPGYNRVKGVCVPKKDCPTCGVNEVYTYCGSGCTDPCESRGKECKDACREGCFCKDDYSRVTSDSPCVPDSECPGSCPDPNESYSECGSRCREKCNSEICATVCEVGCFCVPGFSRNSEGKCIPTKKCPPKCKDPNEEYTICGNTCKEVCGSDNVPCPLTCKAGCFCKAGYSRNNNVCIETSQCPGECKDPNEIYTTCGNTCREQCGSRFCPTLCEIGCFCRPGYSRVEGVCVPKNTCPTCGENEAYTYCGSGCTDPCETRGQNCLDACREGCFCKDNYSRVTPDTPCVPDSECPPSVTCGRYEVYSDCGRDCQTTCDNMGVKCPIVHVTCPSECYCLPGYARIYEGGSCVDQDICPSSPCGDNEVWLECGEPKQPVPCPQSCQDVGRPCQEQLPSCEAPVPGGCYCKPGFARAPLSERCVPISSCSSYRGAFFRIF